MYRWILCIESVSKLLMSAQTWRRSVQLEEQHQDQQTRSYLSKKNEPTSCSRAALHARPQHIYARLLLLLLLLLHDGLALIDRIVIFISQASASTIARLL